MDTEDSIASHFDFVSAVYARISFDFIHLGRWNVTMIRGIVITGGCSAHLFDHIEVTDALSTIFGSDNC
jgi:hypothetical protein